MRRLDKYNGLRGRNFKSLPAAHVLAHQLIVDANHVVTGLFEPSAVVFVKISRRLFLLYAFDPSNIVVVSLTTERARIAR